MSVQFPRVHCSSDVSSSLRFSTGGRCGCSGYSTLLYALSAAVAVLVLLLFLGFVVIRVSGPNNVAVAESEGGKIKLPQPPTAPVCSERAIEFLCSSPQNHAGFTTCCCQMSAVFFSKFSRGSGTAQLLLRVVPRS